METGTRVYALSHTEDGKVFAFGAGVYIGDRMLSYVDAIVPNPCIKLDAGGYVFGAECWWGPEDKVKAKFKIDDPETPATVVMIVAERTEEPPSE